MKQKMIYSAILIVSSALVLASCQSSRVWGSKKKIQDKEYYENREYGQPEPAYSPRYESYTALIIAPHPGFVMKQHPSGRFYHRSPAGFLYWKGYDNRFYIDRMYLSRLNYSRRDYDEWKRHSRNM